MTWPSNDFEITWCGTAGWDGRGTSAVISERLTTATLKSRARARTGNMPEVTGRGNQLRLQSPLTETSGCPDLPTQSQCWFTG